jgi:hypothetical protein
MYNTNSSFQINQPTRCNNFSSLLLTFMYSSTCFGRPHAHHQGFNNCSSSLWVYRWSVLLLNSWWWVWGRPEHVEMYIKVYNKPEKLLHLVRWFTWIVWRCTDLQTLNWNLRLSHWSCKRLSIVLDMYISKRVS